MEAYVQLDLPSLPADCVLSLREVRGARRERFSAIVCNVFRSNGYNPYNVKHQIAVARRTGVTRATLCLWIRRGVYKPHCRTIQQFVDHMEIGEDYKKELEKFTRR